MNGLSVFIWFFVGLIILAVIVLVSLKVFRKVQVDEETQKYHDMLGDNPAVVINFMSRLTDGHARFSLASIEGQGLGGNNRLCMFPRDVFIERDGGIVKGAEALLKLTKLTVSPTQVVSLARHNNSDFEDTFIVLPHRAEDLPEGIRPLFENYLRLNEILLPYQESYRAGLKSSDDLMKVLMESSFLGDDALKKNAMLNLRLWESQQKTGGTPPNLNRPLNVGQGGGV
jgi:hypothetical protein